MKNRLSVASAVAAALLVASGLASCAASQRTVTITSNDHEATLRTGDELVIDFGEVNASVGSNWVVIADPDPAVLTMPEKHTEYLGENGSVGAPDQLTFTVTAVGSGTTRLQFEYQFRGGTPTDPTDQKTALIDVTVR